MPTAYYRNDFGNLDGLFRCEEIDGRTRIESPVGAFWIDARVASPGDPITELIGGMVGTRFARPDPDPPAPAFVDGRLNPPRVVTGRWTFQVSQFFYTDGTESGFLGCYPIEADGLPETAEEDLEIWITDHPTGWFDEQGKEMT